MSGLFCLLFTKLSLPSASAIQGKTVLITGANTGLGKEAAQHALTLGAASVILGVRNTAKGEDAVSDIESRTGLEVKSKVHVWKIDLESFASVREFAARVRKHITHDGGRLDVAIMNAGLASVQWAQTADGWERSLQVNVLSTALLSIYLLPLLLRTRERDSSSTPHLAILASDNHKSTKFGERRDGDILLALNNEGQWKKSQATGGPTERYGVTKLLDIFIAMELAARVPHAENGDPFVVVNAVAPGFCKSELLSREKAPWILKVVQACIARTTQEGSKTLLHAVTRGPQSHGKWLENQIESNPGSIVTDSSAIAVRKKIWTEIVDVLKAVDPEVSI